MLANLAVHLRALPHLVVHVCVQALEFALLLARLAPEVVVAVPLYLPWREDVVEEDRDRDRRRGGLAGRAAAARAVAAAMTGGRDSDGARRAQFAFALRDVRREGRAARPDASSGLVLSC